MDEQEHRRLAAASSGCGSVFVGITAGVAQVERLDQCARRRWGLGAE